MFAVRSNWINTYIYIYIIIYIYIHMIHSWFHIFSGIPRQQWQVGPAPFRRATGRGQRLWAHSVHHRHVLRGALCWDAGARCFGSRVYRDRSYLPHLQQLGWVLHWLRLGEKNIFASKTNRCWGFIDVLKLRSLRLSNQIGFFGRTI